MKKLLFAILIMALGTAIMYGYTYEFSISSNAAGTCDVKLYNGADFLGSGSCHMDGTNDTGSIIITTLAVPTTTKIHGYSDFSNPIFHHYQTEGSPSPPHHVNYVEIDIDGIENPDPGSGQNPQD
jgi:hypothetical protein